MDTTEGRASPNSVRRKPPHPDAEAIADDRESEQGEQQRPAAEIVIGSSEDTVCGLACAASASSRANALPLLPVPDVSSSEEAGAQYSQSPAIAKGPLGDAASLTPNVAESLVNSARFGELS
ncbi:MAG: hypothetical protein Q7T45_28955 [Bradyrhizobium sp.]|uniref:hypothetical protein n=1 Tax=Bradyrhizobium sp. TaxID=376 RepID=UPI002723E066|nr:hypothetical protein [Bradyrhizobium sp.]MDO8401844.1 hypothetical protein [Bradyrhizobium sp.]